MMRKAVITGLGMITPLGRSVPKTWSSVINLCADNRNQHLSDLGDGYPSSHRHGMVISDSKVKPLNLYSGNRRETRACTLACIAAKEALISARLITEESEMVNSDIRIGCAVGSGLVNPDDVNGTRSAFYITTMLPNIVTSTIARRFNLCPSNDRLIPMHTYVNSCVSGTQAIGESFDIIRRSDKVDAMICGGTESCFHPLVIEGFRDLRVLSPGPDAKCKPMDVNRDGFVMSEGAAFVVVEEEQHAIARGAPVYGRILAYRLSGYTSGLNVAASCEDAIHDVLRDTIQQAQLASDDTVLVSVHAAGTRAGDPVELRALERLGVDMCALGFKGALGHMLAASGPAELILSLLCCKQKLIVPTLNLKEPISCSLSMPVEQKEPLKWPSNKKDARTVVLKNSIGFGGLYGTLAIEA